MTTTADTKSGLLADLLDDISVDLESTSAQYAGDTIDARTRGALIARLSDRIYVREHAGRDPKAAQFVKRGSGNAFEHDIASAAADFVSVTPVDIVDRRDADRWIVMHQGVRIAVPARSVTETRDGASIRLDGRRPRVSPGFFLVRGSRRPFVGRGTLVRLYCTVDNPVAALGLWRTLVRFLGEQDVPWQMKMISDAPLLGRNDSLVIYFPRRAWPTIPAVVEAIALSDTTSDRHSPFTTRVGPGISYAFEPADPDPRSTAMSFGQHRSTAVAEALISHAAGSALTAKPKSEYLVERLAARGIDPTDLSRNLSSPIVPWLDEMRKD
ncbi:T3SS effector HopA1 family protein [Rhodococcus sp. IEGM 1381]|uniref:T3SS effector HopA1 family protein n=1 Tax=Rhodococcus sp. IEGM 1381 TaxID=3047085 RepID=UPI0024B8365A|nr:T3SS effector HopA1 family protein [Rhodococcus sp. IEGM 1381]MDI9894855.1 T3SS effector HopA1 family protein [Rhodococcus sp. IEGM 1381]